MTGRRARRRRPLWASACVVLVLLCCFTIAQQAGAVPFPRITLSVDDAQEPDDVAITIQILFLLTILSLAPAILIMLTSFTRVIVVLSFLRHAMGTQQMPPNQVLVGLALFLTAFIMMPVWTQINDDALAPYLEKEIDQETALENAVTPLRDFMLKQTREKDLSLFVQISRMDRPGTPADLPMSIVVPSFVISELRTAFQIGFLLYVPFLVIDMVVASVLMSMGMLMLPPIMISLPFKILLFVLVDGWNLLARSLAVGFG